MAYNHLFSPVKIGNVEIPNRIALIPMGVLSPRMMNRDRSYTKDGADYYIMISAMSGRSGTPGGPAPSALPNVWDPSKVQREMTVDEIHQYVEWFVIGAKAAKDAGIDGVEIHAVHEGYLLDQFAISSFNKRTDEYGGSLENRLRFPTEIVQAIKAKCGKDFPVSLRYSVKSYTKAFNRGAVPGEKFEEFGRDYEESKKAARMRAMISEGYKRKHVKLYFITFCILYWPSSLFLGSSILII